MRTREIHIYIDSAEESTGPPDLCHIRTLTELENFLRGRKLIPIERARSVALKAIRSVEEALDDQIPLAFFAHRYAHMRFYCENILAHARKRGLVT